MKILLWLVVAASSLILPTVGFGQSFELPTPSAEHKWLEKFIGEWETNSKGTMGPDQPPMECKGKLVSKSLGGFWVHNTMEGDAFGTPMKGIQLVGFDPDKKKYVGTWVDSVTSFLWHYEGSVDKSGKILTLDADGPNMLGGTAKTAKFQDIYEFKSADEIIMTSKMQDQEGKWVVFMQGTAKRIK